MSSTDKEAFRVVAVEAAMAVLEGRLGVIEGSRRLREFGSYLVQDVVADEDFVVFVAVDSETDALPIGTVRELWNPIDLEREDREIAGAEAMHRESVVAACQSIIERFGKVRF